jgi:hypothetical protein
MEEQKVASIVENRSSLEGQYIFNSESRFFEEQLRTMLNQITTNYQKLDFSQLSFAFNYLKASLAGVFLDTFREYRRPQEFRQGDSMVGRELWERIQQLFTDVREQRLAFLLFHCYLSPTDILRYAPQEFRDKQEICYLRRKMLDRILLDSDHMH